MLFHRPEPQPWLSTTVWSLLPDIRDVLIPDPATDICPDSKEHHVLTSPRSFAIGATENRAVAALTTIGFAEPAWPWPQTCGPPASGCAARIWPRSTTPAPRSGCGD